MDDRFFFASLTIKSSALPNIPDLTSSRTRRTHFPARSADNQPTPVFPFSTLAGSPGETRQK
jgi:hypothetical protein